MNKQLQTLVAVFDLDGTLLDTLADLTDSVNFAMEKLNLPTHSAENVRGMIGSGVSVLISRALGQKYVALHDEALSLQRSYYRLHSEDKTAPYLGVWDALNFLKERGVTIVVHTNKDENVAIGLCERMFGERVDFVCGTVDDGAVKPNAERLKKLLENLHCKKAVYCGDSDVDIATAKNAGVSCVSVTWGFKNKDFLQQHGATCLVDTPSEAASTIWKIFAQQK